MVCISLPEFFYSSGAGKSLEPGSCVTNLPYWVSQCTCISVLLLTEMRGLLVTSCRMAFPWIIHLAPTRFVPH